MITSTPVLTLSFFLLQYDGERTEDPLSIENTLWANTVVASGTALGVVVYTGSETRSVMNTSHPKTKVCENTYFFYKNHTFFPSLAILNILTF